MNMRIICLLTIVLILGNTSESWTETVYPKSIPALRNRTWKAEQFKLLDEVPARKGLYAVEFSYISDGNLNYGLIERPAETPPGSGWPVIILAHGHIPPKQYSTVRNYRLVTQHYAAGGFMVIKPDYRGHGRSEGDEERSLTYTIDYSIDILNLLAGIEKIPDSDTDNVFLYGHSMGGEIALRILAIIKNIRGATLWAAVTLDFPENTLYYIRRRNPELAKTTQKLIEEEIGMENYMTISPFTYLNTIRVPLLIRHGTADKSVPFIWSEPFLRRLDTAGVSYTFFKYANDDHNLSKNFYTAMDADMKFFRSLIK